MTIIAKKYFDELYTITPLTTAADLSEYALEQAIIQHKFKIEDFSTYILYLGRDLIGELIKLKSGYNLFKIEVVLQESLKDEWYLVNEKNKLIIYSPGV